MKHLNPKPLNPSFCFSSGEAPAADAPAEEEQEEEEQEVVKTASGWEDFLIWRGGTLNLDPIIATGKLAVVSACTYIYTHIICTYECVCVYTYI